MLTSSAPIRPTATRPGGTVNITTKSGTNKLHGSVSEFYQDTGCSNLYGSKFVSRAQNACTPFSALPYSTVPGSSVPTPTHYNQFGGTIGGPVFIPKVFDGRNKLFFFYAYEGYVGAQPAAQVIGTVPTAAERNGDFSALLALGSAYQMYKPLHRDGSIDEELYGISYSRQYLCKRRPDGKPDCKGILCPSSTTELHRSHHDRGRPEQLLCVCLPASRITPLTRAVLITTSALQTG